MSHGGARNRSGPPADPSSGRSDQRGFKLTALPASGFDGEVPAFPLPQASDRELEVWGEAWRTPQACAWSLPSESWRGRTVGMWVRWSVRAEAEDASAAVIAQVHRLADQIGFTTAGLAEMGWQVAVDELSARRPSETPAAEPALRARRLRAASDGH